MNYFVLAVLGFALAQASASCNPEVQLKAYTSTDTLVVNEIAFVGDITLACKDGSKDILLYAAIGSQPIAVTKVPEPNRYLISWSEQPAQAKSGSVTVNFYDENGYAAFRKALRSGQDPTSVTPLTSTKVNVEGVYRGPTVNSESLALLTSIIVWYMAYRSKSDLVN